MVTTVTTEPVCANCDHKHSVHQRTFTTLGKRPCMFIKRNGRTVEPKCDCTDYVDAASPAGATILKTRAEKARLAKK